jgi:O-antigen ligase
VPPAARRDPRALASAVLLLAFAAGALLSIGWADERSAAWDGANRALLYAALFALFALWPMPARQGRWLLTLAGLGIALIGTVELLRFAAAADPGDYLVAGRFAEPVAYQNGAVALWLMGAFCCLSLSVSREATPVVRGLSLGAVPLLAALALMGQSRGSLFALPLGLALFLAVTPGRLRVLAALVPVALAVLLSAGPSLDVIDSESRAVLPGLVDDAARAILLPAAIVAAFGALAALAETRRPPSAATARRIARGAGALVALVVLVGAVVALTQAGEIRSEVSERWDQFKSNESAGTGSARLGSGGTNRYDFWTVAWDTFEREPLRGVGMDNFQQDYMVRGESREKPRFPHSFELAVLSETGLVGAALLAGALAAALAAALALRRRATPAAASVLAAAVGLFGYWLLHASVDWLYELPALGGLAFALLGLAAAVADPPAARDTAPEPRRFGRAGVLRFGLAALAVAAAVSFALPWLSEREVEKATAVWRANPDAAYERLDRAAGLNPVSVRPLLFEGTLAVQLREPARAERAFLEALEREPRNQYSWLHLAALASARQDRALARRRIAQAAALSPRDEATRMARAAITEGTGITPQKLLRAILKYSRNSTE